MCPSMILTRIPFWAPIDVPSIALDNHPPKGQTAIDLLICLSFLSQPDPKIEKLGDADGIHQEQIPGFPPI